ncbi:MAG: GNAT family N-acetyltransferase [Verrucomicrobiota bacterium]
MKDIEISEEEISPKEYWHLVEDVGWKRYVNSDAIEIALKNSLWSAVAKDKITRETVGYVRVVGDGAIFYYVQDLMVLKRYRKKGIGRGLMEAADRYLKQNAPAKSSVGLFTHPTKQKFYEKFAFNGPRPSLIGMYKKTNR